MAITHQASGQYIEPGATDRLIENNIPIAVNSQNVQNTGTDVFYLPPTQQGNQGCALQVAVWDGSQPGFGWQFNNGAVRGALMFADLPCENRIVSDPDVVLIGNDADNLYAVVVGIDEQNFIKTYYFKWSGKGFEFTENCNCRYGFAWPEKRENFGSGVGPEAPQSGYTLGRRCLSPNVDANETGQAVIVWVEQETIRVEATLGFPFTNTSLFFDYHRGNVLTVSNTIEGIRNNECFNHCETDRAVVYWEEHIYTPLSTFDFNITLPPTIQGFPVDPIIYNHEEILDPLYWYSSCDVAISSGTNQSPVVTFVYYRNTTLPGVGTGGLRVVQRAFDDCELVRDWSGNYNNLSGGVPRIAAPPRYYSGDYRDFAIVDGLAVIHCGESGYYAMSDIVMFGNFNNTPVNGGNAVSLINSPNIKNRLNQKPVVAFSRIGTSSSNPNAPITVAWESVPKLLPNPQNDIEIVAGAYAQNNYAPVGNAYSIVNHDPTHGRRQVIPSIAGRRMHPQLGTGYFWYNSDERTLAIKNSRHTPGLYTLTSSYCFFAIEELPAAGDDNAVRMYPNGALRMATVELNSADLQEYITGVQLVDMTGKVVLKKQFSVADQVRSDKIHLPRNIAKGIYQATVESNKQKYHLRLVKD